MLNKKGFTLIELIISTSILLIMTLAVFQVYSNTIRTNKQLELASILQENVRDIIQEFHINIKEYGVNSEWYDDNLNTGYEEEDYLALNNGKTYTTRYEDATGEYLPCIDGKICEIVIMNDENIITGTLHDDVVEINNLKFYISKVEKDPITGIPTPRKITITMDMKIRAKQGISEARANRTNISIQTTISEKVYKK